MFVLCQAGLLVFLPVTAETEGWSGTQGGGQQSL